jgi:uncharacterized protein YecE (DUF72 family)
VAGECQRDEIAHIVERMRPIRVAVEFRHRSWADPGERRLTADLLRELDAAWVCVDTPERDVASVMPRIVEVTSPGLAYLRMHGRNAEMWTKGRTVAERFDYDYADDELEEWVAPVLDMAQMAQEVAVVMNNNARDYALQAADRFADILARARAEHG